MYSDNQRGFTLIEWLIGLSIGIFLLGFVMHLYLHIYRASVDILGSYEMQSNGRIALSFLAHDIRMAGFIGCPNLKEIKLAISPYQLSHALIGNSEIALVSLRRSTNHDRLYLQYADPNLQPIVKAQNNTVQFRNNPNFPANTVLVISDCRHAEVFQLANVQLKHQYKEDATVSCFYRIVYYIAPINRKNSAQNPMYALYRKDLNTVEQPSEIVQNIAKLDLRYGVLNHSKIDYLTAENVLDWEAVRSVEVTVYVTNPEKKDQSLLPLKQVIMIRSRSNH